MKLCDDCLRAITFNLNQNEVVLLQKMRDNHMETPHLAIDEAKMITLVKGLSPYKIKNIIQRFLVVGLINTVKYGSTKYYISDIGIRLIEIYLQDTKKIIKK